MLLVVLFALASIVPGSLHAAVMNGPALAASQAGGHHDAGHHAAGHTVSADAGLTGDAPAAPGHYADSDLCCPATCSIAICGFETETAGIRMLDRYEFDLEHSFVVLTLALPDRPPRA